MKITGKLIVPLLVAVSFGLCGFIAGRLVNEPWNAEKVKQALPWAEQLPGLEFDPAERELMAEGLAEMRAGFEAMRELPMPNQVAPALVYNPFGAGYKPKGKQQPLHWQLPQNVQMPREPAKLAFYSVGQLASLLKNGKITSVELTRFYLDRLKKYGDTLECVISITEELAMEQARQADAEIAAGNWRGPLHGIPYGAKDLLAVPGYKTTWGAMPYKNQELDETATVVKKLKEAGAVLVAKLTLGALAWGDVWYGGTTRNPWNLEQGSSGSSAGSASATAAGLVAFSIGTETLGSIVSPSTRCGTTGLRPTFGRVSRHGAMALSWSMDKIGPICRSAADCAMVFAAIHGTDGLDASLVDAPFNYAPNKAANTMRVGYLKSLFEDEYGNRAFDQQTLKTLQKLGIDPVEVKLPEGYPMAAMRDILSVEAAAAFDELTRTNADSLLVRQVRFAWPNVFRQARFVPAVEYVQANRFRAQMAQEVEELLSKFDAVITPSYGGDQLTVTNLTGHPCVVVPNGFTEEGTPVSISFIGPFMGEASLLRLADAYQQVTTFDDVHPEMFVQ